MNDKDQLLTEVKKLRARIAELEKAETERKNAEEKLKANNQQLQSTEQQLQATNQQLMANNQQLIVSEKSLRESEAKFKSYIKNAPDGVFIANEKGKYIEVNKAACSITGYSEDELLNLTIPELIQEEYLEKAKNNFQTLGKVGFASSDLGFITKSGEKRFWSVDAVKLSETRFLGFAKDITERKRAEDLICIQRDIAQALNTVTTTNDVLSITLDMILERTRLDAGGVYLVDENTGDLKLVCSKGLSSEFVETVSHYDADSPNTRLVMADNPIYIQHTKLDVPLSKVEKNEGLRIMAIFPVSFQSRVIACLNVASHTIDEISISENDVLNAIAYQLGQAISRIRSEEALRENRANLLTIIENTPDSIWAFDANYDLLFANSVFTQEFQIAFGIKLKPGINLLNAIPEEIRPEWKVYYDKALANERLTFEKKFVFGERTIYSEVAMNPIVVEEQVVGVSCFSHDITERKQAEEALRDSEARWQFAVDGSALGLWDWNVQTSEVFFSKQWKAMLGFKDDEISESLEEWDKRVHPDDKEKVYADINKHLDGNAEFYNNEHRVLCKNNSYKWILDRGKVISRTDDGKPLRMIGTHTDITERKQAEEELRKTHERLELAMDAGEHGFWDWDLNTDKVYFSPRYYTMLGYEPGELPMQLSTWVNLMHPEDRKTIVPQVQKHVENAETYEVEFRLKCKDGTWKWISGRGKSFGFDKSGKPQRAVGVHVDITKRKLAEQELKKHRDHLEELVKERTEELEEKNKKLEKFNDLFVNREFRIKELKDKIEELKKRI